MGVHIELQMFRSNVPREEVQHGKDTSASRVSLVGVLLVSRVRREHVFLRRRYATRMESVIEKHQMVSVIEWSFV